MKALYTLPLLAVALFTSAPAHAETVNCTNITSLPTTITTQGVYCLKQDLATSIASGNAITINTNNVTIDCNDFKIGGTSAGPATWTNGVFTSARNNITVRNCNVRGFRTGIYLLDGTGHTVLNNRVDLSTHIGIRVESSAGGVVRGNRVVATGGANEYAVHGIYTWGNVDVIDNTVSEVTGTPAFGNDAIGIYALYSTGSEISRNRISNLLPGGGGARHGIYAYDTIELAIRDNSIAAGGIDIDGPDIAIRCTLDRGIARDNMVSGFDGTVVEGCLDVDNSSR